MSTASAGAPPLGRHIRHKHLRYTSWTTVIIAILGFPPALYLYSLATASCWGRASSGIGQCEIYSSLPWIGLVGAIGAYLFVIWIIHELGHETYSESMGWPPATRYAWQHAKLGYKDLDKGHHRLVRRVHRVASLALTGLAAYVSFQFFEADTLITLAVVAVAYTIGEILNWKTYPKVMKQDGVNV
jgi:hypothetical protein